MGKPTQFLRETIKGGIFFVIPLTVILVILAKAHAVLKELTAPIASLLPNNILGINGGFLIALCSLILVCFLGGLFVKSERVKHRISAIEDNFLSRIPGYSFIKAVASDTLEDGKNPMQAVMVPDDKAYGFGLIIERSGSLCTIYIPGAPNASSGEVKLFDIKDVVLIDVKAKDVLTSLSRLGKGGNQWLLNAQNRDKYPG